MLNKKNIKNLKAGVVCWERLTNIYGIYYGIEIYRKIIKISVLSYPIFIIKIYKIKNIHDAGTK